MSEIIIVRDDGDTLLGSDGDHIYEGVRVQVGWDELTVTTEVAQDGMSFVRTTSLPDGSVHGVSNLDWAGFVEANELRIKNALGEDWTDDAVDAALETAWEAEKNHSAHGPVFIDVIVDGELTQVEKKITYIAWTEK